MAAPKKLLFIYFRNKLRSLTAGPALACRAGSVVDSGGLNHDAEVPLSTERLERSNHRGIPGFIACRKELQ